MFKNFARLRLRRETLEDQIKSLRKFFICTTIYAKIMQKLHAKINACKNYVKIMQKLCKNAKIMQKLTSAFGAGL